MYGYDLLDNLVSASQTDPTSQANRSRTFNYDSFKRLVRSTNPESGQITYQYDDSGNLSSRQDALHTLTFGAYDGMSRVTGKSYSDGTTPQVTYGYGDGTPLALGCNGLGRLTSVTTPALASPTVATVNSYSCFDKMGRVKSSSQQFGNATPYTFSYTYDLTGALASETYPSGWKVTNGFDSSGRIDSVTGATAAGSTPYVSNVLYQPWGAIGSYTLGNTLSETWSFNGRQQPTQLQVTAGGTTLLNLGWGYGADATNNGNIASHTIARSTGLAATVMQSFSNLDAANRIATASEAGGWSQTYLYDAFGNRAVEYGGYMPNAGLTPVSAQATPTVFPTSQFGNNQWIGGSVTNYDGAGNQSLWGTSGTFAYDGENRLVSATQVMGQGNATFAYDGEGRRVQKTAAQATTIYIHDAMGHLAAEYGTAAPTGTGTEYLTADQLGSTRLVTDGSGTPKRCIDYLPFGEEIPSGVNGRSGCYESLGTSMTTQYPAAADLESLKFTGKERDAETGLDYFGARYFASAQGRWTSPDWSSAPEPVPFANFSNPQTLNLYGYVGNNPLGNSDPDGHWGWADFKEAVSDAFEIGGGMVKGAASSLSGGLVGSPKSTDSLKSRIGQAMGTIGVGIKGAELAAEGTGTAAAAVVAAPSAVSVAAIPGAILQAVAGSLMVAGSIKNAQALQNTPGGGDSNVPKPRTGKGSVPPDQRDPKRVWTKTENGKKLDAQGGECAQCGEPIKPGEARGHHVDRHADGGQTNDQNHVVVCKDCHIELHKQD